MGVLTAHFSTPIVLRMRFRLGHYSFAPTAQITSSPIASGCSERWGEPAATEDGGAGCGTAPPSCWPSLSGRWLSWLRRCLLWSAATQLNAPSNSILARLSTFCLVAGSSISNPYWWQLRWFTPEVDAIYFGGSTEV